MQLKYSILYFRQMVYPEKPLSKDAWRLEGKNGRGKFSGKFRLGSRDDTNYWQENLEQWEQDEEYSPQSSPRQSREKRSLPSQNGGSGKRMDSRHTDGTENGKNVNTNGEFVHHPGFQGSEPAKLKVGKKMSKFSSSKSDSALTSQNTFRPKGFGSLYDEMEFQRRYKKVFDVNNHIHFVHSNYISGQKLSKRTKLPPIGYVPGLQAESQENLDIFAIMSVQKYNHPPENEDPNTPAPTHRSNISPRKETETEEGIRVPPGFIPSPAKSYSKSPFNGIKGSPPHNMTPRGTHVYRLPTLAKDEPESHIGQMNGESEQNSSVNDDIVPLSDRSYRSKKSTRSKLSDNSKIRKGKTVKTKAKHETDKTECDEVDNTDEMEPFTFSIKVQIKPKEPTYEAENDSEMTEGQYENKHRFSNNLETSQTDKDFTENTETRQTYSNTTNKIVYPSQGFEPDNEISVTGEKVVTPKNIAISANEFGIIRKKVQYPESFVLENSLAEVDESRLSDSSVNKLNVPSNNDNNESQVKSNERTNSNLSSGHASIIPEIRTICPTPNPNLDNDDD